MSDLEFDILDELYFVEPYSTLKNALDVDEVQLKNTLADLLKKGWVKCFDAHTKEPIMEDDLAFDAHYQQYHYLATKEGLLAHNSR
ncbi:MAG: transporter [Microscillaceae bacterium]|nr:transporter [Microscillaceae bacterium]